MKIFDRNDLIDVRQTPEYSLFMKKNGWLTEKNKNEFVYIKKLPLLPFSVAKILRNKKELRFNQLRQLIKRHKIILLKIQPFTLKSPEPDASTTLPACFSYDSSALIPTKTVWLDLTKKQTELLKAMKKKTRYGLRQAGKNGVRTQTISGHTISRQQLNDFYQIWVKNKPFDWFFKPRLRELEALVKSFGRRCYFVFAYHCPEKNEVLIAAVLIIHSSNMAFDWYGASTKQGRQLSAKILTLWQAIKEAKSRGLKVFDFEGIYDPRFRQCQKGWQGFTHFKKGFGGKEVSFSPSFKFSLFNL